jgi:antitoxin (DNA-binding transcriptional repressor) of toxin-antitoxin stability system
MSLPYGSSMGAQPEITQRDLQTNSGDILDALEAGQAFTVTRDGRQIGELIPVQPQSRFVLRAVFATSSRNASAIDPAADPAAFRAGQNAAADQDTAIPNAQPPG